MSDRSDRFRLTRYERDFAKFCEFADHEIFFLELLYSDRLGAAIRAAVARRLDEKQAAFDQAMAARPEAVAERARWQRNRQEMIRRLARHRPVRRSFPVAASA